MFCREFYPEHQLCVLFVIVTSLVVRTRSLSAVFCLVIQFTFTTRQALNNIAGYEKVNKFNKQTCLTIKTQILFHFSTYSSN